MRPSSYVQSRHLAIRVHQRDGRGPALSASDPRIQPAQVASVALGGLRWYEEIPGIRDGANVDFTLGFRVAMDGQSRPMCLVVWRRSFLLWQPIQTDVQGNIIPPKPGEFYIRNVVVNGALTHHVTVGEPPQADDVFYFPLVVEDRA